MWRWCLAAVLVLAALGSPGTARVPVRATMNAGHYADSQLDFAVTWDSNLFAMATVVGGGILLSDNNGVLFLGPDTHQTALDCIKARIKIDMIDAPLLYAYHYDPLPVPEPVGVTDASAALYAWPDGVPHIGWFGCRPLESGGFVAVRLLARTWTWAASVTAFAPVMDAVQDTSDGPASTPVGFTKLWSVVPLSG